MDIKVLEEKENSLLNRKELLLGIDSPGKTPTNEELKKELATKLKTKPELVIVKNILQIYGKMTSKVKVYIYRDEKSLKAIEQEKPKKEKPKEKKEAKPEWTKEAKPKEEKKEEEVKEEKE